MIDNLTDAIAHAREVAENLKEIASAIPAEDEYCKGKLNEYLECIANQEQLVAWLTELAERREADKWNVIRTEADLPKESDWYFVTRIFNSRKYVATVFFNEDTKSFYEDSCTPLNNIIAWKPLPEPYTESEVENGKE